MLWKAHSHENERDRQDAGPNVRSRASLPRVPARDVISVPLRELFEPAAGEAMPAHFPGI
jgi:hypothetical protein